MTTGAHRHDLGEASSDELLAGANSGVSLSIVVTTYEWHRALDLVLRALWEQSDADFDLVVADDGSGAETAGVVERWRPAFAGRLSHVWQQDNGYRVATARNRGALAGRGDYVLFIDGDCLPRRHFVHAIKASVRPNWFLSGRRIQLSDALTRRVLECSAHPQRWSLLRWLLRTPVERTDLRTLTPRDRRGAGRSALPDFEPEGRAYGFLIGVARADLELVNGFDERFVGWGEEDVDLAVRLQRLGLRCGHAGPQATLLHLWHPTADARDRPNWSLLEEAEQSDRIEAVRGLRMGRVRDGNPNSYRRT